MDNIEKPVEVYPHNGFVVEIYYDPYPPNPRYGFHYGTMYCSHSQYTLGDVQFDDWDKQYASFDPNGIILPIFLYDSNGITLSSTQSNSAWNFGLGSAQQVGWIYMSPQEIRKEFSVKNITKRLREEIAEIFAEEIDEYSAFLEGDIYGYVIKDENDNTLDTCWGYESVEYCKKVANEVILTTILV